jgi:hypothetical protein
LGTNLRQKDNRQNERQTEKEFLIFNKFGKKLSNGHSRAKKVLGEFSHLLFASLASPLKIFWQM